MLQVGPCKQDSVTMVRDKNLSRAGVGEKPGRQEGSGRGWRYQETEAEARKSSGLTDNRTQELEKRTGDTPKSSCLGGHLPNISPSQHSLPQQRERKGKL